MSDRKTWIYLLLGAILLVLVAFFVDQHSALAGQREAATKDAKMQAYLDREQAKDTDAYLREAACKDAAEQYGIDSAVTKQKCPGTKAGKQLGF